MNIILFRGILCQSFIISVFHIAGNPRLSTGVNDDEDVVNSPSIANQNVQRYLAMFFEFTSSSKEVVFDNGKKKSPISGLVSHQSRISVTLPAPTVWPPSRMENFCPTSMAIG